MVGYPSIQEYNNIIKANVLKNCPFTIEDIRICDNIFGPNICTLKGMTVCTNPKAEVNDYINILQNLKERHQNIVFCESSIYIQGYMFLYAVSKTIKFIKIKDITETKIPILNK